MVSKWTNAISDSDCLKIEAKQNTGYEIHRILSNEDTFYLLSGLYNEIFNIYNFNE